MEYVKKLLEAEIKLHEREMGRARNQGHLGKVERLTEELNELKWVLLRVESYERNHTQNNWIHENIKTNS